VCLWRNTENSSGGGKSPQGEETPSELPSVSEEADHEVVDGGPTTTSSPSPPPAPPAPPAPTLLSLVPAASQSPDQQAKVAEWLDGVQTPDSLRGGDVESNRSSGAPSAASSVEAHSGNGRAELRQSQTSERSVFGVVFLLTFLIAHLHNRITI
jgi:hypothetical protein